MFDANKALKEARRMVTWSGTDQSSKHISQTRDTILDRHIFKMADKDQYKDQTLTEDDLNII